MQELVNLGLKRRSVSSRKSTDMFDSNGRAYDYYAINRHCAARDIPGIIVEQCFMDSEYDQQFITSEEGLQSLGDANARGIAAYLGLLPKDDDTAEE
jgi:N-acetylmuramoyl-L-alanine amidase